MIMCIRMHTMLLYCIFSFSFLARRMNRPTQNISQCAECWLHLLTAAMIWGKQASSFRPKTLHPYPYICASCVCSWLLTNCDTKCEEEKRALLGNELSNRMWCCSWVCVCAVFHFFIFYVYKLAGTKSTEQTYNTTLPTTIIVTTERLSQFANGSHWMAIT